MTERTIYLDHAATTPLDPEVLDEMMPWLSGANGFGNASSIHGPGRAARNAIDEARDRVAALIGADYSEITFASGGTEADNLALIGVMRAAPAGRDHLIVSAIEHHAVLHTAHALQAQGFSVTVVLPDRDGVVHPTAVADALTPRTALVSVMHSNNEIGTLQPVSAIAEVAHKAGAHFHTDAVQSVGLLSVDVNEPRCDLLTLTAHKIYGPKGAGALYIRQGVPVAPILFGGSQEREKRAGTENVAALVGLGAAAVRATADRAADADRLAELRDRLLALLRAGAPDLLLNGHAVLRLPNNLNVSVPGIPGATMLMSLDRLGVAASGGSACSSGSIEPSHVLTAIGRSSAEASAGVRFSIGRHTTAGDIDCAGAAFCEVVHRLRRA